MTTEELLPSSQRPHMVMLVGNHVVGDSRVEKSAVSAVNAGYRVTLVGIRHKSVFQIGRYEQIPIYRVPFTSPRQVVWNAWNARRPTRSPDWSALLESENPPIETGTPTLGPRLLRPLTSRAMRVSRKARRSAEAILDKHGGCPAETLQRVRDKFNAALPGGWRTVWPQTADYEEAFLEALIQLKPDIIHAHDRHPVPGAAAYTYLEKRSGRHVPWVYDAHEWIPGQHVAGPAPAKTAWMAAEYQLIRQAEAVVTVTERIAEQLQRRHRLAFRPGVVINAPRSIKQPMPPDERRPIREECGLGPDVPLLVYVGGLAEHRGVFTMIDALTELPEAHLAFAGSRNDAVRQQMRDRAASLKVADRLHIFDYVPSNSVTWYIGSATCGVSALFPLPGHSLAMPTKLREYAQAGLPVVVSDITTQAAFVTEHGVGTVFEPCNPSSLADAVRRLLGDIDTYRTAVQDPNFLSAQTWEGNEQVLTEVWHSLCPVPAHLTALDAEPQQGNPDRHPSLVVVGGTAADPVADAWCRLAGDAISRPGSQGGSDNPVPALAEALQGWAEIDQYADAVLYRGNVTAHGDVIGETLAELRSLMHRGKLVGVLTDAELVDPQRLPELLPGHAIRDWDTETFERFRRQVLRVSRPLLELRDAGVPLFTPRRVAAAVFDGVHWVPTPIPAADASSARSSEPEHPVRILIVPTTRSRAENSAIDQLADAAGRAGLTVDRPRYRRFHPAHATRADIVIDAMTLGDWTLAAAYAWSASRIVVGHVDAGGPYSLNSLRQDPPVIPVADATPTDLVDTVLSLAQTLSDDSTVDLRRAGRDFASSVHDGRLTVETMRALWDL